MLDNMKKLKKKKNNTIEMRREKLDIFGEDT